MSISFQDSYVKAQYLSGDNTTATLTQLKQDINIGYKRFDAAIARYFTRRQKFTNLVANQKYYQTPVDSIRVMEVTVIPTSGYEYPLIQVRSEHDWRMLNIVTGYASNLPTHYFIYGDNQIGIYPQPSSAVTNGLRFVYQPQDVDLTKDDYSTGTVTVTVNTTAVTGAGTAWVSKTHVGMWLQVTDGSDGNWYQVDTVTSNTALTIITPYSGTSVSAATYKLGQLFIFPGEYDDVPVDYALSRYYESRNNPNRAQYHLSRYSSAVDDAVRRYASSSTSNVITDDLNVYPPNIWQWPPQPGS